MKNKKSLWLLVLIVVVCLGLVACTPNEPEPTPAEVTITLDVVTKELDVYDTFKLTATVSGTDQAVTWTSSNEAVATVANGTVTAVSEGSATITASVADKSATCAVTVTNSHTAPVIRAERTNVAIDLNATYDLVVETLFKGNVISDVTYTWTLSDGAADDVATVTGTATGATIKGLKYGDTAYTVSVTTHGATVSKQINVSVRNSAISFDTSKFVLQDGAYSATLALVDTDTLKTTLDPQVKVLENNVEVADATLNWTTSNASIVAVENGKFVAKSEGVVTISTSYQNNSISVKVNSIRPEIKLSNVVEIELARLAPLSLSEVQGTVSSVTFNDTQIFEKIQDDTIVLKESALPTEYSKMGKGNLVIQTNLAIYKADAEIYTMIIRNVADYATFQDRMFEDAKTDWIWGGYYVLGNDIDAQGATLTNRLDYTTLTATAGSNAYFYVAGMYGFNGVFDGRGYAISNATFDGGDAGIIGVTLHDEGIVRNLSLLNVTQNVNGLISRCGGGLVENIYVTIKSVTALGNQWLSVGAFSPSQSTGLPKLKNSVAIYLDGAITNTQYQVALGGYHLCYGSLSNAYAIGAPATVPAIQVMGTQTSTEPDVYGSYATATAFAKDVTVDAENGWDMSYWTTVGGVPVPKTTVTKLQNTAPVASLEKSIVSMSATLTVNTGALGKIVLSDAATELGITVDGNVITVPSTVPDKTVVNFSVVNVLDETKKVDLSFTVDARTTENKTITTPVEIELNNTDKPTVTIDLGLAGTLESITAKIGSVKLANATVEDGKLVIAASDIPNSVWGSQTITASIATSEHFYEVEVSATVITKVIRNVDDYATIQNIMFDYAKTDWKWGGYFVLGNNIDAQGATLTNRLSYTALTAEKSNANWWDVREYGFNGIFDGRGYAISNATFEGSDAGIIGYGMNKDGVVRNLSLLNVTQKTTAGLIARMGGKTENVFITIKSVAASGATDNGLPVAAFLADGAAGSYSIHSSVVIYLDGAFDSNPTNVVAIAGVHTKWGVLNRVYAIGAPTTVPAIKDLGAVADFVDVYGSYATAADFAAAVTVSAENGWDMSYWTTVKGIPFPTSLASTFVIPVPAASVENETYTLGSDVTVNVGVFGKVVLDQSAIDLGVTLSGNVISVPTTVANGSTIRFSVVNVMDESKKVDLSFVADSRTTETLTVSSRTEVELNNADKTTHDFALTLEGDYQSLANAKIGELALGNVTFADGKLTIDLTKIPNSVWGEANITIAITTSEHFYNVTIPVTVITKVIRNLADFDQYQDMILADATDWIWGGYFVLGNDINADGAAINASKIRYATCSTYDSSAYGFNGIFDGRGYCIDNGVWTVNESGIVGTTMNKDGIVRNLSLTNVTHNGGGGLICFAGAGTIENVFVTVKSIANGGQWAGSAVFHAQDSMGTLRIEDCVAIFLDGAIPTAPEYLYPLGSFHTNYGILNRVYAIGVPSNITAIRALSVQTGAPDITGSYATAADFAAAVTVSAENGWDMSYWTTDANGAPIPKTLVSD